MAIVEVPLAYHQKIQMMHVKFAMFAGALEDEERMHRAIESIVSSQVLTEPLEQGLYSMVD